MEIPDLKDLLPGALGSFGAAALWLKGPWGRRITMASLGSVASFYGSPYLATAMGMTEGLAGFLLGLFGMAVVDNIFKAWHERGFIETIRDVFAAIRGKG